MDKAGIVFFVIAAAAPLAALVIATVVSLFLLAAVCFDLLIIEPIAWLIDRPALDKLGKVLGVTLVIVGFHFDLLGS